MSAARMHEAALDRLVTRARALRHATETQTMTLATERARLIAAVVSAHECCPRFDVAQCDRAAQELTGAIVALESARVAAQR